MTKYQVLEPSFIGLTIVPAGTVVDINDDPKAGGMTPGKNLAKCDDEGNMAALEAAKAPKASKVKKPVADDGSADLA